MVAGVGGGEREAEDMKEGNLWDGGNLLPGAGGVDTPGSNQGLISLGFDIWIQWYIHTDYDAQN